MAIQWSNGCIRIELQDGEASHPIEERRVKMWIRALSEGGAETEVQTEGRLGVQLAYLLHACVVLSGNEEEEWFVPNVGRPLHLRRQGRQIEIARYPTYVGPSPTWLTEDGLFLVDFATLLESLSAAVEWLMNDLPAGFEQDDTVQVLVHQWERAWQRFSRLATFRRVVLTPVIG